MAFKGTGPGPVLASGWALIGISSVAIIARVYLRLIIQKRRFFISDILMVAAWICGCITTALSTELAVLGALEADVGTSLLPFQHDPVKMSKILKTFFLYFVPFHMSLYLCRGALLSMYLHIFPGFMKTQRILIWTAVGYNTCAFTACMATLLGLCYPVETLWDGDYDNCPAYKGDAMFKICWGLNIVGNLFVFLIPWLLLPGLTLRTSLKACVHAIFLLGLVTISFSVARFVSIYQSRIGYEVAMSTTVLWCTLECNLEVVLACLPALGPYFSKTVTFKKVSSVGPNAPTGLDDERTQWTQSRDPKAPEKCHTRETSDTGRSQSISRSSQAPTL